MALRDMAMRVTPEEFNWQEAHYDYHSEHGRELLFLIANHEWVRATSEIVEVIRSDVVETTIKTDIDLGQIKHEAFRGRSGSGWLPIAVLPPQKRRRQVEPDLFATVIDAAGNLLPLLPGDDLGHQISAALAEIIVNMAVAHWPNWRSAPIPGDRSQAGPGATRDERVLLSAAIYRLLRRGPRRIGVPADPATALTPAYAAKALRDLLEGEGATLAESGFSGTTFRINQARKRLLGLLDRYTVYLAKRASPQGTAMAVPDAEFVPELAYRAVRVLQALAASTIVVVPVDFRSEPTVLTVRVPTRNLNPGWLDFKWRQVKTWRISPRSWLIRPSAQLAIDVLLPTADADRQIQIHLADGVSFEPPASAFVHIVKAIGEYLNEESPPITRNDWSVSYARLQVATGQIGLGHMAIRLHDPTQDRQHWNSGKTEQMAREVSARAAQLAAATTAPAKNPDSNQDPVIRIDFVSKDPPHP